MPIRPNHDFTIENKSDGRKLLNTVYDFGEVPAQGLTRFRLQEHVFALAEYEAAEAIELGLVKPTFAARDFRNRFCFLRWKRRPNRQVNRRKLGLQLIGAERGFLDSVATTRLFQPAHLRHETWMQ